MVHDREDVVGMDGAILTHRAVLKASGHEDTFSDPMVDCRTCKARLRADQLPEKNGIKQCPNCGGKDLTEPRPFNLMFSTQIGASADPDAIAYLRPETAQSIFVQFKNVLDTARKKLPFGIAQIGKAFRNEINPRNFIFRSREFEQMELEYFCRPEQGMELLDYWHEERLKFYENIGIARDKLHVLTVPGRGSRLLFEGDLRHRICISRSECRSWKAWLIEPITISTQHQKASGKPLDYFDEETEASSFRTWSSRAPGSIALFWRCCARLTMKKPRPTKRANSESRIVLRFIRAWRRSSAPFFHS